jgi:hypothetical protein
MSIHSVRSTPSHTTSNTITRILARLGLHTDYACVFAFNTSDSIARAALVSQCSMP